jgi:hypothetical protein
MSVHNVQRVCPLISNAGSEIVRLPSRAFTRIREATMVQRSKDAASDLPLPLKLIGKAAYTVDQFCAAHSVGRTKTYEAMNDGRLDYVIFDGRRLILAEQARDFLARLPRGGRISPPRRKSTSPHAPIASPESPAE